MDIFFGLIVLGIGFLLFFFPKSFFKKDVITMNDYEKQQDILKNKILSKTQEQKKENRDWFKNFFGAIVLSFCIMGCGKTVFIIPEIPQEPKIEFKETVSGFLLIDSEVAKLRLYIESCKLWREKCLKMLEEIK